MKITEVTGTAVPVEGNDIDTDRIIPARYMKEVTFANMGQYAFHDARFDSDGRPKSHPFNDPEYRGASILIVNKNFGCGSSREHAPQALMRTGIRAVVGESFAEIFSGNCTVMGIPTATASESGIASLIAAVKQNPRLPLRLSLAGLTLSFGETSIPVHIPPHIRRALTEGIWDSTRLLLANLDQAKQTAARLPYVRGFSGD